MKIREKYNNRSILYIYKTPYINNRSTLDPMRKRKGIKRERDRGKDKENYLDT